jgi:hypothetical protein
VANAQKSAILVAGRLEGLHELGGQPNQPGTGHTVEDRLPRWSDVAHLVQDPTRVRAVVTIHAAPPSVCVAMP